MTILFACLMIAVLLVFLIYGAMEKEWLPLQAYTLGLSICFLL